MKNKNREFEFFDNVVLSNGLLWIKTNQKRKNFLGIDIFPRKKHTPKKYKVYAKVNKNKTDIDEIRIIFNQK